MEKRLIVSSVSTICFFFLFVLDQKAVDEMHSRTINFYFTILESLKYRLNGSIVIMCANRNDVKFVSGHLTQANIKCTELAEQYSGNQTSKYRTINLLFKMKIFVLSQNNGIYHNHFQIPKIAQRTNKFHKQQMNLIYINLSPKSRILSFQS